MKRKAARPAACPVNGCRTRLGPQQMMCSTHWSRLPVDDRERLAVLALDGRRAGRFRQALRAAVLAVEARQGGDPGDQVGG